MTTALDIVIPIYNEGEGIIKVLNALKQHVHTPFRVLLCYDRDDDTTLLAVRNTARFPFAMSFVKNQRQGAHGAVLTGFEKSSAPAVLVYPGDDDYNAGRVDSMVEQFRNGAEIVAASRFMSGGCMVGCPWLKASLVRASAFVLFRFARVPTHDPSNGFRLFSRRVLETIPIESTVGFTYSLELLAKCHRLGWQINEVPVEWHERKSGRSRFRVLKWMPHYLVWFFYCFATALRLRKPDSVRLKESRCEAASRG
jgi:glycosyltransferase involved in cell wall biosynthesis